MESLVIIRILACDEPGNYRFRVQGFFDGSWSERISGLRIATSSPKDKSPVTSLFGQVRDQAELTGVLNTLYELHMAPLSVEYQNE